MPRVRRWAALAPRLPRIYAGGLLLLALLALIGPYTPPDSDLWYHLAHGRYIAENHAVPATTYFSYQTPERRWVHYYWLFELVVYGTWRAGGAGLLLALRAAACLAFLVLLARFLAAEGRAARSPLWISLLLGLAVCATWYRLSILRPHLPSYLAILAFLWLCEGPERRRWWLVPLTVVWMNLHGIYYPVVLLVALAYGAEWLVRRARGLAPAALATPLTTLAVVLAIFATPHGRALAAAPFVSTATAGHYIGELAPIPWTGLLTYQFFTFVPQGVTAAGILLLLTLVGLVALAWSGRLRLAHLLLVLGGLVLLSRAGRFTADFSILALPLLRELGPLVGLDRLWHRRHPAGVLLALVALVPAYARLGQVIDLRPGVGAISLGREPAGPAAFITRLEVAGPVMNHPNDGGYLEWALPRRNQIFMDLEAPALFRDEDWYEIKSAYDTEFGLRAFLERHRPAFVLGRLDAPDFGRRLARDHPDYRPVYFDDRRVLWADRRQLPAVVEAWEITAADPYEIAGGDISGLGPPRRARLGDELARLAAAGEDSALVAGLRARLALAEGDPRAALDRLREAPAAAPDDPWLSGIEAAAHSAAGDHAAAVEALRRGLAGARDAKRQPLLRSLAAELDLLGRPEEAYRARLEAFGEYNPTAPPEELLELAAAALRAGRGDDARELLERADRELTAEDPRRAQLEALRARLPEPHQAMP